MGNFGLMATKEKEKAQAKMLFIELGKPQKVIASMLGVSEKTISRWATDDKWNSERTARQMATKNIKINGRLAMSNLSQILIDLQQQRAKEFAKDQPDKGVIQTLDAAILSYTHGIAQAGAQVGKIMEDSKITLAVYLQVMDEIFNTLLAEDSKLHSLTIDFQERHIQFICKKLG